MGDVICFAFIWEVAKIFYVSTNFNPLSSIIIGHSLKGIKQLLTYGFHTSNFRNYHTSMTGMLFINQFPFYSKEYNVIY